MAKSIRACGSVLAAVLIVYLDVYVPGFCTAILLLLPPACPTACIGQNVGSRRIRCAVAAAWLRRTRATKGHWILRCVRYIHAPQQQPT